MFRRFKLYVCVCSFFLFLKMTPNLWSVHIIVVGHFQFVFYDSVCHRYFARLFHFHCSQTNCLNGFCFGYDLFPIHKMIASHVYGCKYIHQRRFASYTPLNSHHSKPHSTDKIPPMRRKTQPNCIQLVFCRSFRYECVSE